MKSLVYFSVFTLLLTYTSNIYTVAIGETINEVKKDGIADLKDDIGQDKDSTEEVEEPIQEVSRSINQRDNRPASVKDMQESEDNKNSEGVISKSIIPNLPSDANPIPLKGIIEPLLGAPISSTEIIGVVNPPSKATRDVMWAKKRADLDKKFSMVAYIYLGNDMFEAAEGMTFSFQGEGPTYFGEGYGGLGAYDGGTSKKIFSLEFDQWYNTTSSYDKNVTPKSGHIAFINGQNPYDHLNLYAMPSDSLSDGRWHKLTIDTVPVSGTSTLVDMTYKLDRWMQPSITRTTRFDYKKTLGTSQPYWGFTASSGGDASTPHAIAIEKAPQTPEIENTELTYYVGETWSPGDGLSIVDEWGEPVSWGDSRVTVDAKKETFTSPGNKVVTYSYKNTYGTISNQVTQKSEIIVKKDESSIVTKNTSIKLGETWVPSNNFVSATDKTGASIGFSSPLIDTNDSKVDISKPGKYELTYSNIGAPSGVINSKFTVEVVDDELKVETQPGTIPLGTNVSDLSGDQFIKKVQLGNKELNPDEYEIELENLRTDKIGDYKFNIRVKLKNDNSKIVETVEAVSIVWGSTLVVKSDSLSSINASVSLLHKEGNPYLNANQASGFSGGTITSRPEIKVYQNSEAEQILTAHYETVGNTPSTLAGKWNTIFQDNAVKYGNVLRIHVNKWNGGANWKGNNTFISRNNTLITETLGYDYAYYELTPSGYRLLRLNQLEINNNQKVKLNTSKEEMNKNISNFISLPEHIENPSDFRMEFESVDTYSSGNKKSTINVYESLESGGEFKTTYEASYTVNPEVTESYYDIDGKQIEQSQTTEFEYGKEFTPNPEKYIESNGELYIYRGWVDTLSGTENIVPQEGVPEATIVEKNYYYIYDKADKFINVTLPTEVVFGTFEDTKKISSKAYEIKNNSDEIPLEISLEQFDKVKSDIKLLSSDIPDPTQEEASAKLNLNVDNENVISGLTEDTPTQIITKIETSASRFISLEGTYFGNMSDKNILDYKMHLKFKATQDNEN